MRINSYGRQDGIPPRTKVLGFLPVFIADKKIEIAFVLLLALSIGLSYAAYKFPVFPFDQALYDELHEETSPLFSILMQAVSSLGNMPASLVLSIMAMAIFAIRSQWQEAIFIFVAAASSVLLAFVLKALIHRSRPFPIAENATGIIQRINQYSYPSGHVVFFAVFFGFFAYLAWLNFIGWARTIAIITCAALIILIAPSRVFLEAHWTSDVIGSYVIGVTWLCILAFAHQLVMHKKTGNPP
jgi:undecaprenyl-diphosphatase